MRNAFHFRIATTVFLSHFGVFAEEQTPSVNDLLGIPTLLIDGKEQRVTKAAYIEHHLQNAKGKFALLAVPDG